MSNLNWRWTIRNMTWGIFPKLLLSFLVISIIPLAVLGYLANKNMSQTGLRAISIAQEMGEADLQAAKKIGKKAIEDSVRALDSSSTEAIELRTVELAQRIADFLYERDKDILVLASFNPDPERYLRVYLSSERNVIVPGPWPRPTKLQESAFLVPENQENKEAWRQSPPIAFEKVSKPLYKEITFVNAEGREKIKIKDGDISDDLRDVSRKENTYCKAEDYFSRLQLLERGEVYVSRMIGPYLRGWLYKEDEGIKVKPESAYAGKENPYGQPFEGIIRWATPVFKGTKKVGYLTMALDHTHIMEFTDHVVPTDERFTELSDGGSGNYAFLWDDQGRCISHARDFFICGYDLLTGKKVPGWLSQETYNDYMKSGLSLDDFVDRLPSFSGATMKRSGSREQIVSGFIPLDCRVLDTAPQCEGWHRGTEDGGSGSFLILWSGLWKLTTYATVPYYSGIYGSSKRGFGYVTIGANTDDFHRAANESRASIEESIEEQSAGMRTAMGKAREVISESTKTNRAFFTVAAVISALAVVCTSIFIGLAITTPVKRLTDVAEAMSRGEFNQHIDIRTQDEIGRLANSFNKMASAVSEVDRMKSEFVTIVSHELRTPIHAMMLGISSILEGYSGKLDQETREDLEVVNDGINRLRGLVVGLLDISRIEARKFDLNLSKNSVEGMIGRAIDEVSQLIESHRHSVEKMVPEGLPDIYVDGERIIQVIINLLSNAIKYTPEDGKIEIWAEESDGGITFFCLDNGYGIPSWACDKIFEKFFQADSIMSQKVGGTGLGLTISKGIVEEHGGTICFESPVPEGRFPDLPLGGERKGTLFIVHLPC